MENKTLVTLVMTSVFAAIASTPQECPVPQDTIHESSIAACYDAKTCDQCKGPSQMIPS